MNEDNDRQRIGLRLRERREYLGLSQDEVAKALKMPRPAISLIESGERKVDILELKRFADLYQQSISYFLNSEGETSVSPPVHLQRAPSDIAELARKAAQLSPADRAALATFADFLRNKSKPK